MGARIEGSWSEGARSKGVGAFELYKNVPTRRIYFKCTNFYYHKVSKIEIKTFYVLLFQGFSTIIQAQIIVRPRQQPGSETWTQLVVNRCHFNNSSKIWTLSKLEDAEHRNLLLIHGLNLQRGRIRSPGEVCPNTQIVRFYDWW